MNQQPHQQPQPGYQPQPMQYPGYGLPPKKRGNSLVTLGVFALIVVVVGGGLWWAVGRMQDQRAAEAAAEQQARSAANDKVAEHIKRASNLRGEGKLEEAVRELEAAVGNVGADDAVRMEAHKLLKEVGAEYGKQFEPKVAELIASAETSLASGDADAAEKHLKEATALRYAPNAEAASKLLALVIEARSEAKMKSFVLALSDAEFSLFQKDLAFPQRPAFERPELDAIFKSALKDKREAAQKWRTDAQASGSAPQPRAKVQPFSPYKSAAIKRVQTLRIPAQSTWDEVSGLYGGWGKPKPIKGTTFSEFGASAKSFNIRPGVSSDGGMATGIVGKSGRLVAFEHSVPAAGTPHGADRLAAFKKGEYTRLLLRSLLPLDLDDAAVSELANTAVDDGAVVVTASNGWLFAGWTDRGALTVRFAAWDNNDLPQLKTRKVGGTMTDPLQRALEEGLRFEVEWKKPSQRTSIDQVFVEVSMSDANRMDSGDGWSSASITYANADHLVKCFAKVTTETASPLPTQRARAVLGAWLHGLAAVETGALDTALTESHANATRDVTGQFLESTLTRGGVAFAVNFGVKGVTDNYLSISKDFRE